MSQSASGRLCYWHRISRRSVWHLPLVASARKKKGRRKRKRRRKRRTPRTSSRSLCARARRRQRQWHVSGFPGDVSVRAVFPSVVVWPEMPCIMAGMTRRTRVQLVGFSLRPLVSGSYLFAVLLGSTVDTCYVSLQRLLWEIAENVPFSAQCLVRHLIHGAASLRGHSTGAALGQGCHALIQRCITVEVSQLQFLFKGVNIPVGAQRHLPMVSLFGDH